MVRRRRYYQLKLFAGGIFFKAVHYVFFVLECYDMSILLIMSFMVLFIFKCLLFYMFLLFYVISLLCIFCFTFSYFLSNFIYTLCSFRSAFGCEWTKPFQFSPSANADGHCKKTKYFIRLMYAVYFLDWQHATVTSAAMTVRYRKV